MHGETESTSNLTHRHCVSSTYQEIPAWDGSHVCLFEESARSNLHHARPDDHITGLALAGRNRFIFTTLRFPEGCT